MTRADLDDQSLDATTSLITVRGELDLTTISELRRRVDAVLLTGHFKVVVDLTGVTHMDSSGLAELITCHQAAQALGGGMALVVGEEPIRRTLEIRGVSQLFTIAASRDDAVTALGGA
jgi:anti-anti-sigma factor